MVVLLSALTCGVINALLGLSADSGPQCLMTEDWQSDRTTRRDWRSTLISGCSSSTAASWHVQYVFLPHHNWLYCTVLYCTTCTKVKTDWTKFFFLNITRNKEKPNKLRLRSSCCIIQSFAMICFSRVRGFMLGFKHTTSTWTDPHDRPQEVKTDATHVSMCLSSNPVVQSVSVNVIASPSIRDAPVSPQLEPSQNTEQHLLVLNSKQKNWKTNKQQKPEWTCTDGSERSPRDGARTSDRFAVKQES